MEQIFRYPAVTVYQSALFQTNATVIAGEAYVLVIDPNWLPNEVDFLYRTAEAAAGQDKERYLLFTHSDYDHIIGNGRFAGYRTIASRNFVDNPAPEKALAQIRKFDDEYYIRRRYPITYPAIDHVIGGEGEELILGEDTYVFHQARGHNPDGLIIYNRSRATLIAGDYLCAVEFPYLYDSLAEYRRTLSTFEEIFRQEQVAVLIPGHGPVATEKREMQKRLKEARVYLDALEQAVRSGEDFDLEGLLAGYDFPGIMGQFHRANVNLVRRELSKKK